MTNSTCVFWTPEFYIHRMGMGNSYSVGGSSAKQYKKENYFCAHVHISIMFHREINTFNKRIK